MDLSYQCEKKWEELLGKLFSLIPEIMLEFLSM